MRFFNSILLSLTLCSGSLLATDDFSNFDLNEAFKDVDQVVFDYDLGHEYTENVLLKVQKESGEEVSFTDRDIRNLEIMLDSYNHIISDEKDDKKKHVSAGRLSGIFMKSVCEHTDVLIGTLSKKQTSFLCSLGAATAAGILKEVYDSTGRGHVEFTDAAATSFGGVFFEIKF